MSPIATMRFIIAGPISSAGHHMGTDPSAFIQPTPGAGKAAHAGEIPTPGSGHSRCVRGGGDGLRVDPDMFTVGIGAHSFARTFAPMGARRDRGEFGKSVETLNGEGRMFDIDSHELSISAQAPWLFAGHKKKPQSTRRDSWA